MFTYVWFSFFKSDITGQKETILHWGTNYKGLLNNLLHKLLCRCSMAFHPTYTLSITWAGFFGWRFVISDSYYEHWDGSETFTATFFAYIFGSIQFDLWRFCVNMSKDLWSAVMWFMQLVRSAQEGQTTLEGKEFSLNFPKTFQISISLRFIFWFCNFGKNHPLVFCVMPVMSLIFRGSRTKVHYRELHCDSHDLDWPSRPMVRWVESGSWDSWLGCDILQNPAECAVCIFQICITYNLYSTCKCENLPEVSLNHAETDAHFVFWRYLWMACWEVVNPGSLRVWHVAARRLRSNRQRRRLWKPWKGVFEKNS